ncbi:CBS domain-containing protein [Paenibacillus sp. NEAU-GSW1]|uniref:CBS domain-containing protein n=1 Tax=Paenibacillus sp. NEAU-GSW1 TaxID=2682486 RepID=UPI0012E2A6D0|nr:CBS domain-containing protein [Paenibacillus sp. NEAU-GSW1]MUT68040.1 CBS domain-containing protein [Paenibacillus sp. NEAU-GSW1]
MLELVKKHAPVTGEQLAEYLGVSRPTLRSDLSLLVMLGLLDAKPKVGYFIGNAYRSTDSTAIRKRFDNMKVHEIQGVPVNVAETLSVNDAVITLFTENADTLLVINEKKRFVGIVTPKDLLKMTLGNAGAAAMPVSIVMTRYPNVVSLHPDDSVSDAIRKMTLHQVDCLPVIVPNDEQGSGAEVTGWVSKSNIIRLLSDIATAAELGEQEL